MDNIGLKNFFYKKHILSIEDIEYVDKEEEKIIGHI